LSKAGDGYMNEKEVSISFNPIRHLAAFFEWVDRIVKGACLILLGVMTGVVFLQVFGRFFLPTPLCWTEELARYLMAWSAFIGASSMIKTWENVYVDFLIEKFPLKIKKIIYLLIKIIILVFMIYITNITLKVLPPVGVYQTTPALGIPMLWAHLGMIIGFILMIVQLIGTIFNDLFMGGNQ
jgi:TRAP-type C4-dicarboxylate transport system permease small subunit